MAACLIAGAPAVLSHRAAAVLFGVSGFRPGALDVTVPPARSNRNALATVHRSVVPASQRALRDRIPVTRPARLLVDLARVVPPSALVEAVDDVLCRRLVSLDRLVGISGAPKVLRQILEAWDGDGEPDTLAEMRVVRELLDQGLPPPVRQQWVPEAAARVDLAYPDHLVAIELDSFRWHAGRRPFDADRARHNRLLAAGWRVIRATPGTERATAEAAAALLPRRAAHVA